MSFGPFVSELNPARLRHYALLASPSRRNIVNSSRHSARAESDSANLATARELLDRLPALPKALAGHVDANAGGLLARQAPAVFDLCRPFANRALFSLFKRSM